MSTCNADWNCDDNLCPRRGEHTKREECPKLAMGLKVEARLAALEVQLAERNADCAKMRAKLDDAQNWREHAERAQAALAEQKRIFRILQDSCDDYEIRLGRDYEGWMPQMVENSVPVLCEMLAEANTEKDKWYGEACSRLFEKAEAERALAAAQTEIKRLHCEWQEQHERACDAAAVIVGLGVSHEDLDRIGGEEAERVRKGMVDAGFLKPRGAEEG